MTYSATILRPRKQLTTTVLYRGHLDVEVREATELEAPLVLRGVPGTYHDIPDHRHFDGGLWKPLGTGLLNDDSTPRTRADLAEGPDGVRFEWTHPLHCSKGSESMVRAAIPFERDAHVREVLDTDLEDVSDMVREAARDMLIVGDLPWERVEEPVYVIHRSPNGDHVSVATFSKGRDQYRLDQGAWVDPVERSESRRRQDVDDFAAPEVTVLRPDLLRARTTEHSVAHVGAYLVKSMARHLAEGSAEDLASYVGVRDAVRAFSRNLDTGGEPDLASLVAAMRDGVETLGRLHDGGYERDLVDRAARRVALENGTSAEPTFDTLRI